MEDLNVVDKINSAGSWLARNQSLLIHYAVNIVAAVVIMILGFMAAKVISSTLRKVMHARGIDDTVSDFLSAIVRYGVIAFTIIAALGRIGVQTASVIAVLGAAGLAVGLALQGSLSNFAAGVLLVIFRPFRAGEYVDLGGVSGTVEEVQIFHTTLRTPDDKMVVVPNGKIIANNIINTSREPNRRTEIVVGVAYDADIDTVKKVLGDIVAADERIMHDKGVVVRLNEMGASTLNFVVRFWTTNGNAQETFWDTLESFKRALDKHNIGIPYPQMDVHLYKAESASAEPAADQPKDDRNLSLKKGTESPATSSAT
ncbi:mechanosensitive ion channel protein MscS [Chimaeribacter californicus]|uniref:Small-conductance mechanosensitive channel n=1 Tax=Chimaeribacter californicus TaxID=2060067 RepID=A0A2N5DVU5_9GAMM|nr:mechanosensitive ion channel protein MscS [Chimaeribacter californicus]